MFPTLKTEVESRFLLAEALFKATRGFKGDVALAAKGMTFVQIYAAYEFTVKSVVRTSIEAINAHETKWDDMRPAILSLYLHPELSSIRDIGEKSVWEARLKLFDKAFSKGVAASNGAMPQDGSHYRYTALELIFRVFDIRRLPVPRRRHMQRIDEVVENRNLIAHGTERAEDIGRRYARSDILHILHQMKSVCLLLITIFDGYCADPSRHRRKL